MTKTMAFVSGMMVGALLAAPSVARAQTATISSALSNFDVVNNTGREAHGFEAELEGL